MWYKNCFKNVCEKNPQLNYLPFLKHIHLFVIVTDTMSVQAERTECMQAKQTRRHADRQRDRKAYIKTEADRKVVWIGRQADKQESRLTSRQTGRKAGRMAGRQTNGNGINSLVNVFSDFAPRVLTGLLAISHCSRRDGEKQQSGNISDFWIMYKPGNNGIPLKP